MNSYRANNNIISFIDFPILIADHPHPLILCICQRGKDNNYKGWICNKCSSNYSSNTPSFYCTYCDYDLCQNCLGEYKLKSIDRYNYNFKNNNNNTKKDSNKIFPWQIDYPNHQHFLSHVKKMNNWFCDSCGYNCNNRSNSYYCSLCDYDICYKCCNNKTSGRTLNSFMNGEKNENIKNNHNLTCIYSSRINDNGGCRRGRDYQTGYTFRERPRKCVTRKPVIYLYPDKEMDISVQLNMDLKKSKFTIYNYIS